MNVDISADLVKRAPAPFEDDVDVDVEVDLSRFATGAQQIFTLCPQDTISEDLERRRE